MCISVCVCVWLQYNSETFVFTHHLFCIVIIATRQLFGLLIAVKNINLLLVDC